MMNTINKDERNDCHTDCPLIVDCDGTLLKTDLLFESFYALIKRNPFLCIFIPFWMLRGKAYLKKQLATRVALNVECLPYHPFFLDYLHHEFEKGRTIILATASFKTLAQKVADHVGVFSEVLASDESLNLSGKQKLQAILSQYSVKGFDYAGNASPDLSIFPSARYAILVNPSKKVLHIAKKQSQVQYVFDKPTHEMMLYSKAIRIYQWSKNGLLLVPLFTSHNWLNFSMLLKVFIGFFAFGCCASGGYLFNDLLDLQADRMHPRKKNRPLASGNISIVSGSVLMCFLLLLGLLLAALLDWTFWGVLLLYTALTITYTLHLKTYVLIDVLSLAGLYTIRIIAGAKIIQVPLSFWLLTFSVCIFFSLALVKRCSELSTLCNMGLKSAKGRDYNVTDINYLREMGISSGYLTIVIVALYINSPDVAILYSHPKVLWLICPLLFYWISRIWLKTGRGEMLDDPIVFAFKDRGSRYVAWAVACTIFFAI